MKRTLFPFLLFLTLGVNAQNTVMVEARPFQAKVAYLGAVSYPGFKLGIEIPMKEKEIHKKSGKIITKTSFLNVNYGFYHHRTFHDNNWLTAEWFKRRSNTHGFMTEASLGLGYSRTFLSGATFEVSDAGQVTKVAAAGDNFLHFTMGVGVGYTFKKADKMPVTAYLKTNLMILTPYNNFIYVRPTVELGIVTPLSIWTKNITKNLLKLGA